MRLVDGDAPLHAAENVIRAQPADPVFLGSRRMIHFQCKGEDRLLAELPGDERSPLDAAQPVSLCWPVERTLAYRRDTPGCGSAMDRPERVAWLALPGVAYLAIAFAMPLAGLLASSFAGPDGLTLAGYRQFFGEEYNYTILWNTLRAALVVTGISLLIGYPTAFVLARSTGWIQAVFMLSLLLPLVLLLDAFVVGVFCCCCCCC